MLFGERSLKVLDMASLFYFGDFLLAVLSGGTGTPKLLQGLVRLVGRDEISVIVNTSEDLELSGLFIAPDLDTVIYTLAGIVNEETWYGIRDDTFACHEMLKQIGGFELLRIGDRDRAVKLRRTQLLHEGKSLSEATRELCRSLGVGAEIIPMSNDRVRTRIDTRTGPMSFHEFWIAKRAAVEVRGVAFEGVEKARAAPGVIEAIDKSEAIVIGPSNPVTSIGPILAIEEIKTALSKNREKVLAVSPIVGNAPVSGPAGVLMRGIGHEVSPKGVAQIYRDVASTLVIHESDEALAQPIEKLGMKTALADLLMPDLRSRVKLARTVMSLAGAH